MQRVLSPAGPEAQFELRGVSAVDSGNYSCVYTDTSPPFAGSKPSATLELRVDGELRARRPGAPLLPGRLSRDPTGGAQRLRGWEGRLPVPRGAPPGGLSAAAVSARQVGCFSGNRGGRIQFLGFRLLTALHRLVPWFPCATHLSVVVRLGSRPSWSPGAHAEGRGVIPAAPGPGFVCSSDFLVRASWGHRSHLRAAAPAVPSAGTPLTWEGGVFLLLTCPGRCVPVMGTPGGAQTS